MLQRLIKKATSSICTYKVAAVAYDKRGNVLGFARNRPFMHRVGGSKHAEEELMYLYPGRIRTIVICRVGHGGILRRIDPCDACASNAQRRGITITSVEGVE